MTTLLRRLKSVDAALHSLSKDNNAIPSPIEMAALQEIQTLLDDIANRTKALEPDLWQRIEIWRNTPWTPKQQRVRNVISFFGYWLAGTIALSYTVIGWFAPLFPEPWYVLPVSAAVAFVGGIIVSWRNL